MLPNAAIASPLAAALFATVFPHVSVTVAPGLPCPTVAQIESAIENERGPDAAATGAAYQLRIAPAADQVRADLVDATGAASWSRSFPAGAASSSRCGSVAEAIALIVERQFRGISWTSPAAIEIEGAHATSPSASASTASSGAEDSRVTPTATLRASTVPAPQPASAPLLIAFAGAGEWTRTEAPSLAVELRGRLRGAWQAGLGTLLPPSRASVGLADSGGHAKVAAVPLLVAVGIERYVTPRLSLNAGAEVLLSVERGESTGIALPATAWRGVLCGGAIAGAALALGDRLRLDLRLGGYHSLLGRSYTVDGVSGTVLEPPAWQAVARIGLAWVFAR